MQHNESGWFADISSAAEVHLRDDERGRLAALILLLAADSCAVREFVEALPLAARQDLADYLESGSMVGRHWCWREPLVLLSAGDDQVVLPLPASAGDDQVVLPLRILHESDLKCPALNCPSCGAAARPGLCIRADYGTVPAQYMRCRSCRVISDSGLGLI